MGKKCENCRDNDTQFCEGFATDWAGKDICSFWKPKRINWKKIHDDFIKWDNAGNSGATQKQLFNYFKNKMKREKL